MDAVATISVSRSPDAGYVISWDERFTTAAVRIYRSFDAHHFERAEPLASGVVGHFEMPSLDTARRCYFLLQAGDGPEVIVAERAVTLQGAVNFRDVGGYLTASGRRVHWGRLFRSGHMANLTAADKLRFAELSIATVCDFRIAEERDKEKTELPGPPQLHVLGIVPGIGDKQFFHRLFARADGPAEVTEAVHQMLASLVREAAPFYAKLFEVLLAGPSGAVLMNCSAGKERTGVATALVLSALGVPRETILYDFMLSGIYFPAESEVPRVLKKYTVRDTGAAGRALIMPLLETRASYLEAAFAAIDADFGSVDEFLRAHYGLDNDARARLLELYTA